MDLSAPIHCLPPELMVDIFRYHTLEAISSAMRIVHVCSRWRAIALNVPELWTTLSLLRSQALSPKHMHHVANWFRRAQPLTVDLYVQDFGHPAYTPYSAHEGVIAPGLLQGPIDDSGDVRPASQVRKLFVNGYPADMASMFDGLPEDAFPRLQSLSITESYSYEVDEQLAEQTISAFKRCPLLTDVTIQMMYRLTRESLSSWLPLPWSQVTTLRLEGCLASHRIVDVLLQCKSLWLAVIQGTINGGEGLPVAPGYTDLPCLHYLEVQFDELQWPTNLFRVLRYPAVERLTLHFRSDHYLWAWGIERQDLLLAAPQFPALWKLTLRGADIHSDEDDLMAFLAALPRTMRFLRFIECLIWPALFERIRVDDGVAPALPNLTELVFTDIEVREADLLEAGEVDPEGKLCRMVKSRVRSDKVECLRAFEFSYRAEQRLAPDTYRKLRSLEGLEVRLPKDAK